MQSVATKSEDLREMKHRNQGVGWVGMGSGGAFCRLKVGRKKSLGWGS